MSVGIVACKGCDTAENGAVLASRNYFQVYNVHVGAFFRLLSFSIFEGVFLLFRCLVGCYIVLVHQVLNYTHNDSYESIAGYFFWLLPDGFFASLPLASQSSEPPKQRCLNSSAWLFLCA